MSTAPPLVDQVLDGRYRVDAHLAEGGMASVYRGHDLRLDRPIALKVMRPDLARDTEFVARFQREARSAAKLSHPHVVSVYDQGEDDGLVYLAMELVTGHNLREIIHHDAPLTLRRAVAITDQILAALSAAHRAGFVHRDIKPENVLTDADGNVKVADFGLARAVTAGTSSRTSDVMWGTTAYLSPEQVQRGAADARTDVYAVGLLLYELLTGRKAFDGASAIHVAFRHVHENVPPVADLVPETPLGIDALIAGATATDPAERPQDAGLLRERLTATVAELSEAELDIGGTRSSPLGSQGQPQEEATRPVHHATAVVSAAGGGSEATYARTNGGGRRRSAAPTSSERAARSRLRRRVASAVVLVLLLLGSGGAAAAWYFTTGPGTYSAMPDVVGMPEERAVRAVEDANLRAEVSRVYSETADETDVVAASEEAGASVRHGTTVELDVSRGPERYAVPELVGMTVAEATEELEATSLAVGQVSEAYDGDVDQGQVVSSSPAPGDEEVAPDTTVDLVVSAGPEPVDIPDVTGSTEDEAVQELVDAGFEVETDARGVNDPDIEEGSVVGQEPSSGQALPGETVRLTLSDGPAQVVVPRVIGMPFDEAERLLKDLGLQVRKQDNALELIGTVRQQSVEGGEKVPEGSEVVLTVI
ncbi:MAG TPA: Stk1 family PASTA domain-containing Ser/Thr kinase [Ornithinimicrobium sp.]|uniref:Stk1 family PASTA domain-containing Ser/Thr kinase n=1 Tax=Ornithinimicrobium sp. TaxID=1977084 RepID=UPI002B46C734|nr:Stk1 family PASTA domain-containing Ser/Thr kinase [Ornithinimicrobium sp.]HKJ12105.1 Stk1 family PASTA domain-containing Ser/Thr kinase [Ornithinimicrobium sp.]